MTPALLTADTSVVVPSLLSWHEHHEITLAAIDGVDRLPGHVLAESYSVLTRLPHGLSVPPATAAETLTEAFPGEPFTLEPAGHVRLLHALARAGIRGGAVYDGVVGATAHAACAELITLDTRAAATYRAVGVQVRVPH